MMRPDQDQRYMTAEGCRELCNEMYRLRDSARILADRHDGWARALDKRADLIEKAEVHEAEAKAERFRADRVANPPASEVVDMFDLAFKWPFHQLGREGTKR